MLQYSTSVDRFGYLLTICFPTLLRTDTIYTASQELHQSFFPGDDHYINTSRLCRCSLHPFDPYLHIMDNVIYVNISIVYSCHHVLMISSVILGVEGP